MGTIKFEQNEQRGRIVRQFRVKTHNRSLPFDDPLIPGVAAPLASSLGTVYVTDVTARPQYGLNLLRRLFKRSRWWRVTVSYEVLSGNDQ